jgi:hypothetical protein
VVHRTGAASGFGRGRLGLALSAPR